MADYHHPPHYSGLIKACVVFGDLCICGGLFILFYYWAINKGSNVLNASLLQVDITLVLCYFICALKGGVVLHLRKVFTYQIVTRVFRTVIYFIFLSGILLSIGKYMNVFSRLFSVLPTSTT